MDGCSTLHLCACLPELLRQIMTWRVDRPVRWRLLVNSFKPHGRVLRMNIALLRVACAFTKRSAMLTITQQCRCWQDVSLLIWGSSVIIRVHVISYIYIWRVTPGERPATVQRNLISAAISSSPSLPQVRGHSFKKQKQKSLNKNKVNVETDIHSCMH